MSKIEEVRKILGNDYVIVSVEQWNNDVEEYKRLREENKRLTEERDSFQRVGIRTLEKLNMAAKELEWVYGREGWVRTRNVLESIRD